ncbi:hypothetical protein EMCG_02019 [[Emmonsia] crescens]|uniref:Uncharacterized protein n=1 Tax=[Emmonsia] crescens TaxID=73230 RepID=A0A0G2HZF0_9EURO|nr:hypothetical protein EMCG_02019 [Emmonsia crescens UAMH 3008]
MSTKRTGYQQSENGMLQSGMYASPSVYLVYPPDRTGRRPSQHALLQYNSVEDRRYHENLRLIQQQQYYDANSSRDTQRAGGTNEGYRAIIDETAGQNSYHPELQTREQRFKDSQVAKPEDKIRKARSPRRQFTRVWTCCQNCSSPGPYSSLYPQCMGCEAPRCSRCLEILVPAQDSPIHE